MGDQWESCIRRDVGGGTNEIGDQWDGGTLGWSDDGVTNEKGDQWDGGPKRLGTNEMGDQWVPIVYWGTSELGDQWEGDQWDGGPMRGGTSERIPSDRHTHNDHGAGTRSAFAFLARALLSHRGQNEKSNFKVFISMIYRLLWYCSGGFVKD